MSPRSPTIADPEADDFDIRERGLRLAGLATIAGLGVCLVNRPVERAAVQSALILLFLIVAAICVLLPWARRARWARFGARALLVPLAVICTALVLDVALHRRGNIDAYRVDPDPGSAAPVLLLRGEQLKWTYAANFSGRFRHHQFPGIVFATNGDGFRGPEWPQRAAPGERRVLVLGDSMTAGIGVAEADCFARRLEGLLTEQSGGEPVRVMNGGVSGYGPAEELTLLERYGTRLQPTDVVATFYDGNDLDDVRDQLVRGKSDDQVGAAILARLTERYRSATMFDIEYWKASSALGRFLDQSGSEALHSIGLCDVRPVWNMGLVRGMQGDPEDRELIRQLHACDEIFRSFAEKCRILNARLLVVRLPARVQAVPAELEKLENELLLAPIRLDRTNPGRTVIENCHAAGIAALDLLPDIEKVGGVECYHREGHWNARGHEVAAAAIARQLQAQR